MYPHFDHQTGSAYFRNDKYRISSPIHIAICAHHHQFCFKVHIFKKYIHKINLVSNRLVIYQCTGLIDIQQFFFIYPSWY